MMFGSTIIFASEDELPSAEGKCTSNYDYRVNTYNIVCCSRTLDGCYFLCVGKLCTTDGDCGGKNECCKHGKCTILRCPECYSNIDCSWKEYCCKRKYDRNVCRRDCLGKTCLSSFDFGATDEYCT